MKKMKKGKEENGGVIRRVIMTKSVVTDKTHHRPPQSESKRPHYYVPSQSRWPIVGAWALFLIAIGAGLYVQGKDQLRMTVVLTQT